MTGYLDNPDATREILSDGWLRTGDLGRLDEDGYLYLTGRSTDLIVTAAGKNVYPDEVEQRYSELPYVRELCVFGVPAERGLGDCVHAVVVVDDEHAPELDQSSIEREIRLAAETISESVPPHQRIAVLHFWDKELPKTSTLKAKRGVIRDMVCANMVGPAGKRALHVSSEEGQAETIAAEGTPGYKAVCEILAGQSDKAADVIRPGMHLLLDLGIDSIGKIDVLGEIESRFRTQIDELRAAKVARVVDLLRIAGDRRPSAPSPGDRSVWRRRLAADRTSLSTNGRVPPPLLPLRWLVRGSVATLMNTYIRVRVKGRENVLPEGPFILAPNHTSHLDTPAVVKAVGRKRRVWVAGAEDYFFDTRLKRLIFGRLLDTIAFDRQADGVMGLRRCGDALSSGDGLLIFPEGTRSTTGQMQPFKIGVAVLAIDRGVPIIPVHIDRAFNLLPKGRRLIRPGTVEVTFGRPIYPPSVDELDDVYEGFRELAKQVESAVIALRDEARV
jgi:long-chain acyl-CoA synthetase